jgi:FkbM family methyltransferase
MTETTKAAIRSWLPKRIKPHRILAGPLRGMRMVTSWHDYPAGITGGTEKQLVAWFARTVRPGETWLDIGAHYGYTSLALSRLVRASGRVFSFEPFVASAGHLYATKRLNRLAQMRVIPIALGAGCKLVANRMAETRGMLDSTVAERGGGELYLEAALDWLWPAISEGDPIIDGVKIDVQGMEIAVVQGMKGLLARWRPKLALEFHSGVVRERIFELLRDAGYRLPGAAIEPVCGEEHEPKHLDNRSYAFEAESDRREYSEDRKHCQVDPRN